MRELSTKLKRLDRELLITMRSRGHTDGLDAAAVALGRAGNNALIWVIVGLIMAAIDNSRWESWLICAALGPFAILVNFAIKKWARRPRPPLEELGLDPLGEAPSSLSFPSAHATSSFAVATAMFRVDPAMAAAFAVALLIALDRPYLGMHYPSDVLVGALLGIAIGLLVPLTF